MSNNANTTKKRPTHQLTFAERKVDRQGNVTMGKAFNVGAVWERNNGKQGGILSWDMSPATLGEGQYRLQSTDRNATGNQSYNISFAEKARGANQKSTSGLSRPVEVASVDKHGVIDWSISPERLNEGAYFVLENQRNHARPQTQSNDAFKQAQASSHGQN